jgi:poly(A) polymerase
LTPSLDILNTMYRPLQLLTDAGIPVREASFTALDAYRGLKPAPVRFALALCALQDLAKTFDTLRYPGTHYADAAIDLEAPTETEGGGAGTATLYIRCEDSPMAADAAAFAPLDLLRDSARDVYLDPRAVYSSLREKSLAMRPAPDEQRLFEAAVLVSRYPYEIEADALPPLPRNFPIEAQRDLLTLMLTGPSPDRGLELLRRMGFVDAYWPELAGLAGLDQSKEYHPEGDAWKHTLETFRHRKLPALGLSLGLLLHDAGKPSASQVDGRKFDRHAEIGQAVSERFLARLGFDRSLISEVSFLVRYHMMPAALPRLPANRVEGVIDYERFPILLELYKCDELSTFRGPDCYYEACAAYKAWLKNTRNPWRAADGKKLARLYLEPQTAPAATKTKFPKGLAKRSHAPRTGSPSKPAGSPPGRAARGKAPHGK